MEEEKGIITVVEDLSKNILELSEEQLGLLDQISTAKNIARGTDNVDNLRLIVNNMSETIEFIVKKDKKVFEYICEFLEVLKKALEEYEIQE
jgi:hypothetical protein